MPCPFRAVSRQSRRSRLPRLDRIHPTRAQHHHPHRTRRTRAASYQGLTGSVQQDLGSCDRISLLPQSDPSAESRLPGRLVQLRVIGDNVRRALSSQGRAPRICGARGLLLPRSRVSSGSGSPGCLHIAVGEGVSRRLQDIHLIGRELKSPVLHAGIDRKVKPFFPAFVHGVPRGRP